MLEEFDWWKLIAGLGIFLFGLNQFETGLRELTGRSFKLFLRKQTRSRVKGILSGTFITAILQSSSVVSLMVLAFVGAGVMSLKHSLGIIFGSNLGTTFTGWIVTILGFKLNIESLALPLIGIGALVMISFRTKKRISVAGQTLVGFGFIFLGLGYMKTSVEFLATQFDIEAFIGYGSWLFLLVGFAFTAIIQSSSATMAITLSALNSQLIPLESAAALVIGADLGTTITVLLGSYGGTVPKKQVALGHFLFNLVTDIIAFIILAPLLFVITNWMGVGDPLISLVIFHSTFNLIGIFIFYPLTTVFARYLERRFEGDNQYASNFINQVTPEVPEMAVTALSNEVRDLIRNVVRLNLSILGIKIEGFRLKLPNASWVEPDYTDRYHSLKRVEGEVLDFYTQIQLQSLQEEISSRLHRLVQAVRNSLHAAKNIKDISHNIADFNTSANGLLIKLHGMLGELSENFYRHFIKIINSDQPHLYFEELANLAVENQRNHDVFLQEVHTGLNPKKISETEISSLLNVNREIYSSNRALILAAKDHLLDAQQAEEFDHLPLYR